MTLLPQPGIPVRILRTTISVYCPPSIHPPLHVESMSDRQRQKSLIQLKQNTIEKRKRSQFDWVNFFDLHYIQYLMEKIIINAMTILSFIINSYDKKCF